MAQVDKAEEVSQMRHLFCFTSVCLALAGEAAFFAIAHLRRYVQALTLAIGLLPLLPLLRLFLHEQ